MRLTAQPPSGHLGDRLRLWRYQECRAWCRVRGERAQAEGDYALPEGYKLEGDRYVYTEPVKAESAAARMAREQREAMDQLRKLREESGLDLQPVDVTPTETPRTRQTAADRARLEEDMMVERGAPEPADRAPDILDWIEGNFPRGVSITSRDFAQYVTNFGNTLSSARRAVKSRGRKRFLQNTERLLSDAYGERADRVLKEMHDQGMFRRIETQDQLLQAIVDAAQSRARWAQQPEAPKAPATRKRPAVDPDIDPWQETINKVLADGV